MGAFTDHFAVSQNTKLLIWFFVFQSKKVNSDVFKWLHKMLRPSNSKLIKWMTDSKLEKLDSKFSSFPYKLEEIEEQFTKVKLE